MKRSSDLDAALLWETKKQMVMKSAVSFRNGDPSDQELTDLIQEAALAFFELCAKFDDEEEIGKRFPWAMKRAFLRYVKGLKLLSYPYNRNSKHANEDYADAQNATSASPYGEAWEEIDFESLDSGQTAVREEFLLLDEFRYDPLEREVVLRILRDDKPQEIWRDLNMKDRHALDRVKSRLRKKMLQERRFDEPKRRGDIDG